jgi:broad specificity phosphatase PhoE
MLQYLIRHGESISNVEERVQGQADVELSPLGRRQAAAVAAWSRAMLDAASAPDVTWEIWSSPLKRARHTAETIAASLGLPVHIDEGLCELHAGVFQGHLWADLESQFPEAVARWRSGDVEYRIPGGESRAELAARGHRVLEALGRRDVAGMIVVAHGGVLTAALGSMLGRDHPLLAAAAQRPFTKLPALANASLTLLEWPGPRLVSFNETGHLAG